MSDDETKSSEYSPLLFLWSPVTFWVLAAVIWFNNTGKDAIGWLLYLTGLWLIASPVVTLIAFGRSEPYPLRWERLRRAIVLGLATSVGPPIVFWFCVLLLAIPYLLSQP